MNHFRPTNFFALSRNEIEEIAFTAAVELKSLKQAQAKRDTMDLFLGAFAGGICFTVAALLFGISLH